MRIFFICLIIGICILQSCHRRTNSFYAEGIVPIKLDFNKTPESIHDIGLITNVEIISLNTPYDNIIIGEICRVIRFNDRLYLLDRFQTRSVFIFDINGNFINVISNFGQGPGEYLQLRDIFIDKSDSTLNLLGRMDRKIFKYDLDGRELLEVIPTPKVFSSIVRTRYGYAAHTEWTQDFNNPHNLWLLDKNLEIKGSYLEIEQLFESRSHASVYNFSSYKGNYYYIAPFFDYYIYSIDSEGITVRYVFDLGRLQLPNSVRRRANQEMLADLGRRYLSFRNFQKTENHLIVSVVHQAQNLLGVYNRNSGRRHIARLAAYEGRYLFGFGRIISFDENTIYSLLDAEKIREIWLGRNEWNNFEETHPEQVRNLRERFSYIDEEDNPFLIMHTIN